jgi:hypothetical protein
MDTSSEEDMGTLQEFPQTYASFKGGKIRIFNSFKEQEKEMIEYWASISPYQRLANLYEMIKISYGISEEEARKLHHFKKINIIKYES